MPDEPIIELEAAAPATDQARADPQPEPKPNPYADDPREQMGGVRWARARPVPRGRFREFAPVGFTLLAAGVGVALSAGVGDILPRPHRPTAWLVTAAVVAVGILAAVLLRRADREVRVAAYEFGLIYFDGAERHAVRWVDVTAVTEQRDILFNALGEPIGHDHHVLLQCKDGSALELELSAFPDSHVLAGYIHEGTLHFLVPRAEKKLATGHPVEFGPLKLIKDGVTSRRGFIPWKQLDSIERADGELVICRKGGDSAAWYKGPTWDIPNVQLFLTLIEAQFLRPLDETPGGSRCSMLDQYRLVDGAPRIGF
jgi:hypothetical protein